MTIKFSAFIDIIKLIFVLCLDCQLFEMYFYFSKYCKLLQNAAYGNQSNAVKEGTRLPNQQSQM